MTWKKAVGKFTCGGLAVLTVLLCRFWAWSGQVQTVFAPVRGGMATWIIDAGHGGEDGGAVSLTGAPESEINLAIARRLDQLLGFCGACPVLLREADISLHDPSAQTLREKKVSDLHNRAAAVEGTEHAVLISIHQNSYPNGKYHGAQVFYANGALSQPLAQHTQELLRDCLDPGNQRTAKPIGENVYLMNHISCPAILVECGFLTNQEEEAKLRTEAYQTQLAAVLAGAILTAPEASMGSTSIL